MTMPAHIYQSVDTAFRAAERSKKSTARLAAGPPDFDARARLRDALTLHARKAGYLITIVLGGEDDNRFFKFTIKPKKSREETPI
jgi:hypothetical protein